MAFCGACCAGGADAEVVTVDARSVIPADEIGSADPPMEDAFQSPRPPAAAQEEPPEQPEAKKLENGDSKDRPAGKQPPKETEGESFDVEIEMPDERLGIDINYCDGMTLLVTKVSDGPIMAHNVENLDKQILVCDRFVEINGVKDDVKEILKAFKTEKVMKATLKRANERHIYLYGEPSNIGLEVQDNDLLSLVCKAEPPAGSLFAEFNKLEPNFAIKKGDCITEINGVKGSPAELKAQLQAGNSWEVIVRRIDRRPMAKLSVPEF